MHCKPAWRDLSWTVRRWFRRSKGRPALEDSLLGTMSWDAELELYSGIFTAKGQAIDLTVYPGSADSIGSVLERPRHILSELARYRQAAADHAAAQLLPLKNQAWLDEGQSELTADEFRTRMRLEALVFHSDGSVAFLHHDGDLFCGHCIEVCMDAMDKFQSANICG
jgi:hypothetical protein